MACANFGGAIICTYPSYRLRLLDGRYVFMSWHTYCGPEIYRDRNETRHFDEWWEDPLILEAITWFQMRGMRA